MKHPAATASPLANHRDTPPTFEEPQEAPARVVNSAALLQGSRAVHISHNGCVYRLQATRLGKLILTK